VTVVFKIRKKIANFTKFLKFVKIEILNGFLKVIETDTDRSAMYDFQLTFHSNNGPISYRFRD